jgi:hypothetical protein
MAKIQTYLSTQNLKLKEGDEVLLSKKGNPSATHGTLVTVFRNGTLLVPEGHDEGLLFNCAPSDILTVLSTLSPFTLEPISSEDGAPRYYVR